MAASLPAYELACMYICTGRRVVSLCEFTPTRTGVFARETSFCASIHCTGSLGATLNRTDSVSKIKTIAAAKATLKYSVDTLVLLHDSPPNAS